MFAWRLTLAVATGWWLGLSPLVASAGIGFKKLVFSTDFEAARAVARMMLQEELQAPVPAEAISVALADLNGDGSFEIFTLADISPICEFWGCYPRVYSFVDGQYRNILSDPDGFSLSLPDWVSASTRTENGFVDIYFGIHRFRFDGTNYVHAEMLPRTYPGSDEFTRTCLASKAIAAAEAAAAAGHRAPALCSCITVGFGDFQWERRDLDLYAKALSGTLTEADIGAYGPGFTLLKSFWEALFARCQKW